MSDERDDSVLEEEQEIDEDEEVFEDSELQERDAKESDVAAQELVGDTPVSPALEDDMAYDRIEKSQVGEQA